MSLGLSSKKLWVAYLYPDQSVCNRLKCVSRLHHKLCLTLCSGEWLLFFNHWSYVSTMHWPHSAKSSRARLILCALWDHQWLLVWKKNSNCVTLWNHTPKSRWLTETSQNAFPAAAIYASVTKRDRSYQVWSAPKFYLHHLSFFGLYFILSFSTGYSLFYLNKFNSLKLKRKKSPWVLYSLQLESTLCVKPTKKEVYVST